MAFGGLHKANHCEARFVPKCFRPGTSLMQAQRRKKLEGQKLKTCKRLKAARVGGSLSLRPAKWGRTSEVPAACRRRNGCSRAPHGRGRGGAACVFCLKAAAAGLRALKLPRRLNGLRSAGNAVAVAAASQDRALRGLGLSGPRAQMAADGRRPPGAGGADPRKRRRPTKNARRALFPGPLSALRQGATGFPLPDRGLAWVPGVLGCAGRGVVNICDCQELHATCLGCHGTSILLPLLDFDRCEGMHLLEHPEAICIFHKQASAEARRDFRLRTGSGPRHKRPRLGYLASLRRRTASKLSRPPHSAVVTRRDRQPSFMCMAGGPDECMRARNAEHRHHSCWNAFAASTDIGRSITSGFRDSCWSWACGVRLQEAAVLLLASPSSRHSTSRSQSPAGQTQQKRR